MIDEFTSLEELYKRVEPALNSKVRELKKLGYSISKEDLWKCFVYNKWKYDNRLMLSDIVDDILNTSMDCIKSYYRKFINNEEII